jgi:hypothetical protein
MRWTWAVIGGVAALLVVAVVDSFRSSGEEPVASTTASRHTLAGNSTLPACTDQQLSLSIDLSGKAARIVARHSREEEPCRFPALEPALTIKDRTGKTLVEFARPPVRLESLRPGVPQSVLFRLPTDMAGCPEGGPFLAEASLGPYPGRRRFSGFLIDCPSPQERVTHQARQAWTAAATRICSHDPNLREPRRSPNRTALEIEAAWSRRMARSAAYRLRKLSALPAPRPDRAPIERMLSLMAEQVAALRLEAAAAAAGDRVRANRPHAKAVGLAQQIDDALSGLASLWDVRPEPLWTCQRLPV